ncbi:transposase domain-containing protein [Pedomonas mirosovicensis]|uniref:transposase domain-containing protein n=1 Tax=Pedomonas mirosovicensis TaxID=2908641 RepID=UPI00216A1C2C|nr:transposase domain-containing protein [Pedomonas mirosovicensis]MCH8684181.1 transposase domain-containing protein [Pedomonas mirosovicensis]
MVPAQCRVLMTWHPGYSCRACEVVTQARLAEAAKLNSLDPRAYLTNTLTAFAKGHPSKHVDALLPWAVARSVSHSAVV